MKRRHPTYSSSFFVVIKVILFAGKCVTPATIQDAGLGHSTDLIKVPSITSPAEILSLSTTTSTVPPTTTLSSSSSQVSPSTQGTPIQGADESPTPTLDVAASIPLRLLERSSLGNIPSPDLINGSIPSSEGQTSSSALRKCTQKDSASLNKCLQQVLKDLKPRLASGIPEINIPPMEPLKLDNVAFQQGSGPVTIASEFSSVEISGLSNFSQSYFWVDVHKRTLDFDLVFPQLSLEGIYELSGNLFVFPIGGNGNFYLNLGGTRAKGAAKLGVFRNATQAQVIVKKTDIGLEIESIKVHLTNLFNGDPLLGTVINNFLNENSQEVFEEVKPQIGDQVGEMLSLLANRALASLSTDQFDQVPFKESGDDLTEDLDLDTLSKGQEGVGGEE